jgi:hypothetical protein
VCSVIRTLSQVSHSCCKIADALIETRQGGDEVEQIQRFRTGYRQFGMYGPPPCCKRKVKKAVWSAQMYPIFDRAEARDLDGMRCALVLTSFEASEGCSEYQVSRAPGSTILPSRCSPADLAENLVNNLSSLVCDCGNREAISKPGDQCQASIADQCLRRDHRQRRSIGFAFGQHRPGDASHLVGQCDSRNVRVNSGCKLAEPYTETR